MRIAGTLLCLCGLLGISLADNWALLVAGSNGWNNYRHQADICHAYQILRERGFHEDKIVVFMYDDIANNPKNPLPGKIINAPNGPDVYKGVKIDYKGDDVTPQNFLNVLQGNKEAMKKIGTGRVIDSTKDDTLFMYYADHGGSHTLTFPNEVLHASDLVDTLRSMSQKNKFKQMLIYIEACEAGSMFDQILGEDLNIFVSTASARDEFSYSTYCNDQAMNFTCLGDLYSVTWMEQLESEGLSAYEETLFEQYDKVRTKVTSHVQLYGNFRLGFLEVGTFLNAGKACPKKFSSQTVNTVNQAFHETVPSRDIPLHMAKMLYKHAQPSEKKFRQLELSELIRARRKNDQIFTNIVRESVGGETTLIESVNNSRLKLSKQNTDCYKMLVQAFEENCSNIAQNEYALKHLYKFANLCEMGKDVSTVKSIIVSVCK